MAVKIRLRREGTVKRPAYRIVVADSRSPRNGRFIEIIGEYRPLENPSMIRVDNERALHWLRNGAQPTEPVAKLLRISGAWEEFKPGDKPARTRDAEKKRLSKKERARQEAAAEAAAATAEDVTADAPVADDAPADEPVAETTAADAPVEEAPVEEAAVEEAPAAEPAADEPVAEDAPAEDASAEDAPDTEEEQA